MSIDFFEERCQDNTDKKLFGICDDQNGERAYVDENNGAKWIAVVENENKYNVIFTAIDNCIEIKRIDGRMDKRCDGILSYNSIIVFVELKERSRMGNDWVLDGEKQLRTTIGYYEDTAAADNYKKKRAYIANSEHPKFKETQLVRMNQFFEDTGYVLRIQNRIVLE